MREIKFRAWNNARKFMTNPKNIGLVLSGNLINLDEGKLE